MADQNGYSYKLTTHFDDGDSVVEYYMTERGVESAKKTWRQMEQIDAQRDEDDVWTITKFELEVL